MVVNQDAYAAEENLNGKRDINQYGLIRDRFTMSARISKTIRLRPEADDFDTTKILQGHNPEMKTKFLKVKDKDASSDSEDSMYQNFFVDGDKKKKNNNSDSDESNNYVY